MIPKALPTEAFSGSLTCYSVVSEDERLCASCGRGPGSGGETDGCVRLAWEPAEKVQRVERGQMGSMT